MRLAERPDRLIDVGPLGADLPVGIRAVDEHVPNRRDPVRGRSSHARAGTRRRGGLPSSPSARELRWPGCSVGFGRVPTANGRRCESRASSRSISDTRKTRSWPQRARALSYSRCCGFGRVPTASGRRCERRARRRSISDTRNVRSGPRRARALPCSRCRGFGRVPTTTRRRCGRRWLRRHGSRGYRGSVRSVSDTLSGSFSRILGASGRGCRRRGRPCHLRPVSDTLCGSIGRIAAVSARRCGRRGWRSRLPSVNDALHIRERLKRIRKSSRNRRSDRAPGYVPTRACVPAAKARWLTLPQHPQ